LGRHQADNAAMAIGLVEASGADVPPSLVQEALRRIHLPGRIEVVGRRPWMIVDTAHNPVSARALAAALEPLKRRRTVLVFGASVDKDARGMLRALKSTVDLVIATRAENPRAARPEQLAREAEVPAVWTPSVKAAIVLARVVSRADDAIVVAGSFYVAGEALTVLSGSL
jgi:folylpolyglutamate synthase/dihydropteroate synthase